MAPKLSWSHTPNPLDPKDYAHLERCTSPPQKTFKTFRLCLPMDAHLETLGIETKTSASTIIRAAVHEYLERLGRDAFITP